ncbi:hypothetical protein [Moheibacter sediminis]|uniref:Uncharacterized protein n=1 Tax=Moheibacter sediminis TaxID=1434700 RepID=A0A1W1Z0X1_9FLAO|nr:hypothetical protein [Moheibacter sediminis]SMC41962.1 hypothetical protein SAMN06296427_10284 [Moheibacter sediminis]
MKQLQVIKIANLIVIGLSLGLMAMFFYVEEKFSNEIEYRENYSENITTIGGMSAIIFLLGLLIYYILKNVFWYKFNKSKKLYKLQTIYFIFPPLNIFLSYILLFVYFKRNKSDLLLISIIMNLLFFLFILFSGYNIFIQSGYVPYIAFFSGALSFLILAFLVYKIDTSSIDDEINQIGEIP